MDQFAAEQGQKFATLDCKVDELMSNLRKQQQTASQSSQGIAQSLVTVTSQNDRIERAIHGSKHSIVQDLNGLQNNISQRFDALQMQKAKDVLIKSLYYPEHELRRATIGSPSHQTFDWIFEGKFQASSQNIRGTPWSDFPKWLREGSSLYWISGKAASGKSTLIAHISNEPTTKVNLNIWATGKPLHALSFFFWRPGCALQKTVKGLLRSLLLQILPKVPGLTESLASEYLDYPDIVLAWPTKQLVTMFERALQMADKCQHCFCIFIDGLDEFEGDVDELLLLISRLQRHSYVKCCVSSRREHQLELHLSRYATLRLEELNYDDIVTHVREKLGVYKVPPKFIDETAKKSAYLQMVSFSGLL